MSLITATASDLFFPLQKSRRFPLSCSFGGPFGVSTAGFAAMLCFVTINEIIKTNNFTPDEWKKVKIKVIHKKGDVEDVSNYRPICSFTSDVQTVLDNIVWKIVPNA